LAGSTSTKGPSKKTVKVPEKEQPPVLAIL
jgi:hypothetical protein